MVFDEKEHEEKCALARNQHLIAISRVRYWHFYVLITPYKPFLFFLISNFLELR